MDTFKIIHNLIREIKLITYKFAMCQSKTITPIQFDYVKSQKIIFLIENLKKTTEKK